MSTGRVAGCACFALLLLSSALFTFSVSGAPAQPSWTTTNSSESLAFQALPVPRGSAVLILSDWSSSYADNVRAQIEAACSVRCRQVDAWDLRATGLPPLNDLLLYDVVLVGGFLGVVLRDPTLGDLLADFMDAAGSVGGGVVAMDGAFEGWWGLQGRWRDGGYTPMEWGFLYSDPKSIGMVYQPDHPVLRDIDTLNVSYSWYSQYEPSASLLAEFSDGTILAAVKENPIVANGARAVALPWTPLPGAGVASDHLRLVVNALTWSSRIHPFPMVREILPVADPPWPVPVGGAKVLLLDTYSGKDSRSWVENVTRACGWFCVEVDRIDFGPLGQNRVPMLSQLMPYDVVVVGINYLHAHSVGIGNLLADYMDAAGGIGGGVVMLQGGFDTTFGVEMGITGRWQSDAYSPISRGSTVWMTSSLGLRYNSSHPLLEGVSNYSSDVRVNVSDVQGMGMRVADYEDGRVAIATCENPVVPNGAQAVALPLSPIDNGTSGDGFRTLVNAIRWASRIPAPQSITDLRPDPSISGGETPVPMVSETPAVVRTFDIPFWFDGSRLSEISYAIEWPLVPY